MMSCVTIPDILPNKSKGQIQVIFGPMFSGKSTELIRRMKRYELANYHCLVIKYAKDDRYDSTGIATHDKQIFQATVAVDNLLPLVSSSDNFDVIGVDEGQFFPDVVRFCEVMADRGKVVIVAALDGTYQRQGFGDILKLVPLAESVMKLTAVCMMCFGEASFTKRRGQEKEVEVIGGADKYLAVCRDCYKQSPSKSPAYRAKMQQENMINQEEKAAVGRQLFSSTNILAPIALNGQS